MTFKDVSNTIQNFMFMGTTVFELAGVPPRVKGLVKEGLWKVANDTFQSGPASVESECFG